MKKKIYVPILIIAICITTTYSQQKTRSVKDSSSAAAQQITEFMTEWAKLSNRHDVAGLETMLPADLVLTFQDGAVQTRDEYLAQLKSNPADFIIKDYDQKVNSYSRDVAVLRERYEVTVGAAKTNFQNTTTFLKRNERWQPIAFHSSPLVNK